MNEHKICAVFLISSDGSCLFQLRDNKKSIRHPGCWSIIGGHAKKLESPEACIKRELFEETGYKTSHLYYLKSAYIRNAHVQEIDLSEKGYWVELFWALYDGVTPIQCHEGQAIRFIKPDEAQNYNILTFLFPYWDQLINEMRTHNGKK